MARRRSTCRNAQRAVTTAYDVITDRILAQLEAGTVPWRQPWNGEVGMPKNLVSGKEYRGVNVFLLCSLGYESPWFVTFKQATKLGGQVRKGERGCPVVFWKWINREEETQDGQVTEARVPLLRYYTVFNEAQCDGIEAPNLDAPERVHEPLKAAESTVAAMPNRPSIEHGSRGAWYRPADDAVSMPKPERFETGEGYYATLFHELTHSTGHTSRLNRKLDTRLAAFGSPDYSREELVAEMGSAFLCGDAGILDRQLENSASYIEGWLCALRNDRRLVVVSAAQAQKAADYILGRNAGATA